MNRLALIGSKEFAHQIRCFAERYGQFQVVGFFDDYRSPGSIVEGLPVLGGVADIEDKYKEGLFDFIFLAAGYSNFDFRERVFNQLKGVVPFANIIMPHVFFDENVSLGEGIFIGGETAIGSSTVIEDNVFIHGYSNIAHDNRIGKHTYISGRLDTAGFVKIGERNFIGIRAIFSDHVETCADVWIGLGCIVAKDIKQPGKYMSPSIKLYKIE